MDTTITMALEDDSLETLLKDRDTEVDQEAAA
jgi:hypothetical protein